MVRKKSARAYFGKRLKLLRESRGFSQQYVADKIGVSRSSIGMYERGEREPNFEALETICDFFDISVDYLFCRI
jgi:repressor LexA